MTTKAKGPWKICTDNDDSIEIATVDGNEFVASITGEIRTAQDEAVAHLIIAAPDLLDALQAVAARWDHYDEADAPEMGSMIRAAISKATGHQHA